VCASAYETWSIILHTVMYADLSHVYYSNSAVNWGGEYCSQWYILRREKNSLCNWSGSCIKLGLCQLLHWGIEREDLWWE